jgi:hypothetical protein
MKENAEKWEAASNELRSAFYARMAKVEKAGISYVLLKRQKKLLDKQFKEDTDAMVFYWKALWVGAAVLAVLEYVVLQHVRGYFSVILLIWIFMSEILKARSVYNYAETKKVEGELAAIRADSEISTIVLGKNFGQGFEKYFENRLFGEYEDLEQYESFMIPEQKRLRNAVFISLYEIKSNPFL